MINFNTIMHDLSVYTAGEKLLPCKKKIITIKMQIYK